MSQHHQPGPHELGQNFLRDPAIVQTIVKLAAGGRGPVIEWAAGDGALTRALAGLDRPLEAVEVDRRQIQRLSRSVPPHVCITHGDILRHAPPTDGPWTLVSNVPFHITTPVLRRLLSLPGWERAVLITQWRSLANALVSAEPPSSPLNGGPGSPSAWCSASQRPPSSQLPASMADCWSSTAGTPLSSRDPSVTIRTGYAASSQAVDTASSRSFPDQAASPEPQPGSGVKTSRSRRPPSHERSRRSSGPAPTSFTAGSTAEAISNGTGAARSAPAVTEAQPCHSAGRWRRDGSRPFVL